MKPTEKRNGAGKGNWGTDEDELVGETEPLNTTNTSDVDTAANPPAANPPAADDKTEPAGEPEKPVMTLEEYLATKGNVRFIIIFCLISFDDVRKLASLS